MKSMGLTLQWNTSQKKKKEKRDELLMHAATWMNLKVIFLSERSQTEKSLHCIITFI